MGYGENLPLIWSLSCKMRREFCPRGAVMHYREARLGALPEADPAGKKINQLHRIIPAEKYFRQLLLRVMREIFYRGGEDAGSLFPLALDRFEIDLRRMIFGESPTVISSLYHHEKDLNSLRRELKEMLSSRCCALADHGWQELLAIPVMQRRFIASPLQLYINELCCYASPLLAYSARGRLNIIELRENDISRHPEVLLMHRFYAFNTNGRNPESVVSCQLNTADGSLRELPDNFSVSGILHEMSEAAACHRQAMSLPLAEIPGNPENCEKCVFAPCCEQLSI